MLTESSPALALFAGLPEAWTARLGGRDNVARLLAVAEGETDWRNTEISAWTVEMGPGAAASFVEQLGDSFDSRLAVAVARSRAELKVLGFKSQASFRLDDGGMLAASIVRRRRRLWFASVSATISQGTYCALDDLWASATCNADFLFARGHGLPTAWPVVEFAGDDAGRFRDYGPGLRLERADVLPFFTARAPLSPSRLGLAAVLSELSVDWILAHETAHELLGHFEHLQDNGAVRLAFADGVDVFGIGQSSQAIDDAQALEMQADWLATVILVSRLVRAGADQRFPLDLYGKLRTAEQASGPDPRSAIVRFRIALAAALGAAMILELSPQGLDDDHPVPSIRVLNILVCAHDLFELIALEGRPDADRAELRETLAEVVTEVVLDLDLMARATGLEAPAYRIGGAADLQPGAHRLAADALMIVSREPGVGGQLATPAGVDYGRLRARTFELWTALDRRRLGAMAAADPFGEDLEPDDLITPNARS